MSWQSNNHAKRPLLEADTAAAAALFPGKYLLYVGVVGGATLPFTTAVDGKSD
jgi:hypothetical protein